MNELFAADPAVCDRASDLKLLLASFGPYARRYLANYPTDWAAQVEKRFSGAGEVEAARVQTLLRRAKENLTLVTRSTCRGMCNTPGCPMPRRCWVARWRCLTD